MTQPTIRKEYVALLRKLAYNSDVEDLLVEVVLDSHRVREQCYNDTGSYPEKRDLLGKLQQDLSNAKELMDYSDNDLYHEEVKNGKR